MDTYIHTHTYIQHTNIYTLTFIRSLGPGDGDRDGDGDGPGDGAIAMATMALMEFSEILFVVQSKPKRAPRPMPPRLSLISSRRSSSFSNPQSKTGQTFLTEFDHGVSAHGEEHGAEKSRENSKEGSRKQSHNTDNTASSGGTANVDIMSLLDHKRLGNLAAEFDHYEDSALTLEQVGLYLQ